MSEVAPSPSLITATIALLVVVVLGRSFVNIIWNFLALRRSYLQISGPKGHWLKGNIDLNQNDESSLLEGAKRMTQFPKIQRIWIAFMGVLTMYYPSVCRSILETDEPKTELGKKFLRPLIGDGLIMSDGKKWRRNRHLLTPAFHFKVLKNYLQVFNSTVGQMVAKWKSGDGKVEAFHDVSLMSLDGILQCAMSYKSNCQDTDKKHQYIEAIYEMSATIMKRAFNPLYMSDFIFFRTTLGRRCKHLTDVIHKQSEEVINARKTSAVEEEDLKGKKKFDFLDILLRAKDSKGVGLSDTEIRDEVDTFMFAGHDTTTSAISWALYNLATHQEEQGKCRREVLEVLRDRDGLEWEDLSNLKYLTMFIKESMRLYSTVTSIGRQLTKPLTMKKDFKDDQFNVTSQPVENCSQVLPQNTKMMINIFNSHRNPHVWADPERFDPLRFTPENISKRPTYSYIPFSAGPRNCIGQNFAMTEIKVTLALVLKNFKISVDESYPKPKMASLIVLKSTTGIHLSLSNVE